ncbi:MAG TPA: glycosyltransferase family 4 protein [Terrimicrobiaceae bacterium]
MKFLFLSGYAHLALDPSSGRASGGAELQTALLSRELVARGHEVVILAADAGQIDGVIWEGIKVRTGGRFDTGLPADTLRALPRLIRVLRTERPRYVVVYGWTAWLYVLCQLRPLVRFRLVFVCALDAEIDGGFRRANPARGVLFERGMRLSDTRFAITEHQARLFRQGGMPCSVTRLLLPQSKFAAFAQKPIDLLWVARCHPVKRPHLFLDLAERLPEARCRMICSVQDEPLWQSVSARASRLQNVEFLAAAPYREIQRHFNEANVFVNTSQHEGVPNTFIHSGLGHAAILSLAVDPDEMFRKFQAGICASGDFERLVREAVEMLGNRERLTAAQDECARFVREWHDNGTNVEAFLAGLPR